MLTSPSRPTDPNTDRHEGGRLRRVCLVAALVLVVVAADVASKAWAHAALAERPRPFGMLTLRLSYNSGVAFGVGAGGPRLLVAGVVGVVVVVVAVSAVRTAAPVLAVALILGGAVGNMADRLPDGRVTDFVDVRWWPVFNGADSAIVVGVTLLLLGSARRRRIAATDGARSGSLQGPGHAGGKGVVP